MMGQTRLMEFAESKANLVTAKTLEKYKHVGTRLDKVPRTKLVPDYTERTTILFREHLLIQEGESQHSQANRGYDQDKRILVLTPTMMRSFKGKCLLEQTSYFNNKLAFLCLLNCYITMPVD